ncbi:hypothetical protein [Pseudosulfitobacter sp. DSM 107133]|uniref:hypothetical protein n=1 Tax=Pseudosulfitobacter sp. DSM 107133 TaxID=2883100 RepID=UPI000DF12DB4|nr:hypothetical protein [Pseudosulfitobacter sp. DSM 107133]UOA25936.1 hypothetical protein DSM107133_00625 [Pseudosulfitobacter sp. DSM 107133]
MSVAEKTYPYQPARRQPKDDKCVAGLERRIKKLEGRVSDITACLALFVIGYVLVVCAGVLS